MKRMMTLSQLAVMCTSVFVYLFMETSVVYANNRVEFFIGKRWADNGVYYAELWMTIPDPNNPLRLYGANLYVDFNSSALDGSTFNTPYNPNPEYNSGDYIPMTQVFNGVNTISINITPSNFFFNPEATTGTVYIATYRWGIKSGGGTQLDQLQFNISASAVAHKEPNQTPINLTYCSSNCTPSNFGLQQPSSRLIGLPTITQQPQDVTECEGNDVTFSVATIGGPYTYQWQYSANGTTWSNIANATAATLTLTAIDGNDAGFYRCEVSSTWATATSNSAQLTVWFNPTLTDPVDPDVCVGQNATFSSNYTGTAPITFKLQRQDIATPSGPWNDVSTATLTTSPGTVNFTLYNVQAGDGDYIYRIVASNACATVISGSTSLTVTAPPEITSAPQDEFLCFYGDTQVQLSVGGINFQTVTWSQVSGTQWNFTGQYTQTLTIDVTEPGYAVYEVVLWNGCGASTATVAVTVYEAPTIEVNPASTEICEGSSTTLVATVTYSDIPPNYAITWYLGDIQGPVVGFGNVLTTSPSVGTHTYYVFVEDANGCTSATMAVVTVNPNPVADAGLDQEICEGGSTTLGGNPTASGGTAPYTYSWSPTTGLNDPTAANPTVTLNAAGTYTYTVTVTDSKGCTASDQVVVTVNPNPVADAGLDQEICEGGSTTLGGNPTASGGTAPYTYSWSPTTGLNDPTAANPTVTLNAAGTYTYMVTVTDSKGCTASDQVVVTVQSAPTITQQPTDQSVCENGTVTFSSQATGDPAPTAQWYVSTDAGASWTAIAGANTASLMLTGVTRSLNQYQYRVEWTNACGTVTSNAVTLTVYTLAENLTHPSDQTVCAGDDAVFTATAQVGTPQTVLTIRWQVSTDNGMTWTDLSDVAGHISGSGTSTLTVTAQQSDDGNQYRAKFTTQCGDVFSDAATLNFYALPDITQHPQDVTICEGDPFTLSVQASGTGLTYQWQYSSDNVTWTDIPGATASTYAVNTATTSDAGYYRVIVSNICNQPAVSNSAQVTVNTAPVITQQPQTPAPACEGTDIVITSQASGQPVPQAQWQVSTDGGATWTDLVGETNPTLTLTNVDRTINQYQYRVVYSNVCGTDVSQSVTVTIYTLAENLTHPQDLTVCAGDDAVYTASAQVGTPQTPLSVQWQVSTDGGATWTDLVDAPGHINGSQTNTLTVTAQPTDDGNYYRAAYTTPCGTVYTNPARLDFYALPEITQQPQGVAVCAGQSFTLSVQAVGTGLTYQWYKYDEQGNPVAIPGATQSTYTKLNAQEADEGFYFVVVSNICNQPATSNTVAVVVNQPPVIQQPPVSQVVCVGADVTFTALATGTGIDYEWYKDGNLIASGVNTITLQNVTDADEGTYEVKVTGTCGVATAQATLTVKYPPMITAVTADPNTEICEGTDVVLTATATGDDLAYEWYKDGQLVGMGATLNLPAITPSQAGEYQVVVSGYCPPNVTSSIVLTVNTKPRISQHPVSQVVCLGDQVSFSVVASGTGIMYQWQYSADGQTWQDIQGANAATFTLASAQYSDEGYYRVIVSGVCEPAVTSNPAQLTVHTPVTITKQPKDVGVCVGGTFQLEVEATGTPPMGQTDLQYQWYKDGVPLPGATGRILTISPATYGHSGDYWCEVTGYCGPVASAVAKVFVNPPTEVSLEDPKNHVVFPGETVVFRAKTNAQYLPTATFQWYRGNTPLQDDGRITGSQSSLLTIRNVTQADVGNDYYVVVSAECGDATSERGSITILIPDIEITQQPQGTTVCEGSDVTFTVQARSIAPNAILTYQWYKDGNPIAGATAATLTLTNVTTADEGDYYVEITDIVNGVTVNSANAQLTVKTAPVIATQPQSQSVCPGEAVTLDVAVDDPNDPTLMYQWYKDGQPITGATSATLEVTTSATMSDAGDYWVEIANECGVTTSETVTVSLKKETVITQQPTLSDDTVLTVNERDTIRIAAEGEGTLTYQWYKDGQPISGATSPELPLFGQSGVEGQYWCVVTGECGEVVSDTVTIVFNPNVAVDERSSASGFILEQNNPNPFETRTVIRFYVPKATYVKLTISDGYGRELLTLYEGTVAAGWQQVKFDLRNTVLSSGTYFYTLSAGPVRLTRQMLIVK